MKKFRTLLRQCRALASTCVAALALSGFQAEAVTIKTTPPRRTTPPAKKDTPAAPQPAKANTKEASTWQELVMHSIMEIQAHGPGDYKASGAAMEALIKAFEMGDGKAFPTFHPDAARPSFCSGAVYVVMLRALMRWDEKNTPRRISPEAWKALLPKRSADGVRPWGYVNANGPGLGVLVHALGAGESFTDISKAKTGDFMKIWWNDQVGAKEHGHLVVFISDLGDSVRVWSSNLPRGEEHGGYGYRNYTKDSIKRAMFTRITKPEAFNNAPDVKKDAWLASLLKDCVSWEETQRRSGIPVPPGKAESKAPAKEQPKAPAKEQSKAPAKEQPKAPAKGQPKTPAK